MSSAYDPIELRPSWGGSSVALFGLLVVFLTFVAMFSGRLYGFHTWSVVILIVLPLLSLAGVLAGTIGLQRSRRQLESRAAALVGLALNATVLGSFVVAVAYTVAT